MPEGKALLRQSLHEILTIRERLDVPEWAERNVRLPSDTPEPGWYSWRRAPYQRDILHACGPGDPSRKVVIVFGAQMGKTLMEQIVMLYYMQEAPAPQAFAFPSDKLVKDFVATKFNPLLDANPDVAQLLGEGMRKSSRMSGDTLMRKNYPGGFLLFVGANKGSSLRGYTAKVVIADEADAFPPKIDDEGAPLNLLERRTNTYGDSRKFILSSTPKNFGSPILDQLAQTTAEKYSVPCPACGGMITLEWDYMRWETNPEKTIVTKAWMECPLCGGRIHNSDKAWMMDPGNGAGWRPTNPNAPSSARGFLLPTTYAPVGWTSWQALAQEWLDASNADRTRRDERLMAFYNTVLCRTYGSGEIRVPEAADVERWATLQAWKAGHIPQWVGVVTTGADVQKDRIEALVIGWGPRMRHVVISHKVFTISPTESMDDVENQAWAAYRDRILNGRWEREDGYVLTSRCNALDRGYVADTVCAFYQRCMEGPMEGKDLPDKLALVRGVTYLKDERRSPQRRKPAGKPPFFDAPVSNLKGVVYDHILMTISPDVDGSPDRLERYGLTELPCDLPPEFFAQLCAESYTLDNAGQRVWYKQRERNEVLDMMAYAYAAFYIIGLETMTDEDWESVMAMQREQMARKEAEKRGAKRRFSKGF